MFPISATCLDRLFIHTKIDATTLDTAQIMRSSLCMQKLKELMNKCVRKFRKYEYDFIHMRIILINHILILQIEQAILACFVLKFSISLGL